MQRAWRIVLGLGFVLLILGCRTPKPDLKPAKSAEVLSTPPSEKRFNSSDYPKEAFMDRNSIKNMNDDLITPAMGKTMSPAGMR